MSLRIRVFATLLMAVALLASACGRDAPRPTSPDPSSAEVAFSIPHGAPGGATAPVSPRHFEFFPLEVGNRWHYAMAIEMILVPREGEPDTLTGTGEKEATLQNVVTLEGRSYVHEQDVITPGMPDVYTQHILWRQDATGLYEAEIITDAPGGGAVSATPATTLFARTRARLEASIADPVRRAALRAAGDRLERKLALTTGLGGGAFPPGPHRVSGPAELTRLRYPLHVGSSWVIRSDFRFTSRVEALETLALAPGRFEAWRMRYGSDLYGPLDVVHVRYGRSGYLGLDARIQSPLISNGDTIAVLFTRQTETLTDIHLIGDLTARR